MALDQSNPRGLSGEKTVTVHLSRRVLVMLWVLLVVPWLLVAFLLVRSSGSPSVERRFSPAGATEANGVSLCWPGPWGTLEYRRLVLEPPEEYVDLRDAAPRKIRWFFKGMSRTQVEQFLATLGLSGSQLATLNGTWMESATGTYLDPSDEFVWNLSAEARARLYGLLGESEENERQSNPYRYRADKVEEWFAHSNLRPETLKMVRHCLYQRGTGVAFADMDIVSAKLPDDAERVRLLSVLTRRLALQVRLRIAENEDVRPLAEYWDVGGRSREILPTLESLARYPGGGTVSIFVLLPRFARMLLNTYPVASLGGSTVVQNCHWTSLNFFRETANDSFATVAGATKELVENFYEIVAKPRLGDVLAFTEPNGGVIHTCVYVADDIVFTKNGISMATPWVLQPLADVSAYYTGSAAMRIRIYRPKERLG